MKRLTFFLFTFSILTIGCSPKSISKAIKKYDPLDTNEEVYLISLNEKAPVDAELIGVVVAGGTGNVCKYTDAVDEAKIEARKMGGNVIKITGLSPKSGTICYRLSAKVLRVNDVSGLETEVLYDEFDPTIDYAILNVYRYDGFAPLVGFDLYFGDQVICRVLNNYKSSIRLIDDGSNMLWARTEKKTEVPFNIEIGKTYYLKCSIGLGIMIGRPQLEFVDGRDGKAEFEAFEAKHHPYLLQ